MMLQSLLISLGVHCLQYHYLLKKTACSQNVLQCARSLAGGVIRSLSPPLYPVISFYNARGLVKVKRCRASTRGGGGGSTDSTDSSTDDDDDAIAGFESVNDRDGSTALIMAVTEGDVEGARALLEVAGADPN